MKFQTNKSFERDLKKSPSALISEVLAIYNQVGNAKNLKDISNLKKL